VNKIIASYLLRFATENGIETLPEPDQFERFASFCVINQYVPEAFDLEEVTTSTDDDGIDGVAVIIDGVLTSTKESAATAFKMLGRRRSAKVDYIFIQAKRSEGFDLGDMLKIGTGVHSLFTSGKRSSDEILGEFQDIHDVVVEHLSAVQDGRPTCSLFYVTTGTWNELNGLRERAIQPIEIQIRQTGYFHTVSVTPIDREKLVNLWVRTRAPLQATFPVKGTVAFPPITGVVEAYLALAPAEEFITNVLSDTEGRLKSAVFEQNVRAFLGEENPVNTKMREALQAEPNHDRFAINNNGITIVSPDVRVQNDRISVTDYQIVNGCQTSHTLYRNKGKISSKVWIPVKVIEASAPDVIAQLVESTNSQTNVDETQFLSIRPFSQRVQAYFDAFDLTEEDKDRRLYFERRTNQFAGEEISKFRIFDIPKLARCVAAMFFDMPHIAFRYPTHVLREHGNMLYRPEHKERAYYTAALTLYRLELALGNNYVPRKYQILKWHMLMMVRYLIAGPDMPRLDSNKIEKYCDAIDEALSKGGKASAPPFLEAGAILDTVGEGTRDKRKGQPYTEDLKARVIAVYKKTHSKGRKAN
jgi:hypothetical protein